MSFTCPRCGKTSHHPEDERQSYCGWCNKFLADEPTGTPEGVRIVYSDGTTIVPNEIRYLGWFPVDDGAPSHVWAAVLPRPLVPGVAELNIDVMPARTSVICR